MIRISFCQTNRLFIWLERAEKEICFSMANSTFKMKMDIDRHGPRLMPNNCKNLKPPHFSLPSTFKQKKRTESRRGEHREGEEVQSAEKAEHGSRRKEQRTVEAEHREGEEVQSAEKAEHVSRNKEQ